MSDRLVFSTDAWPERDRFAAWAEEFVRLTARLELAGEQSGFRAKAELKRLGAIDISHHTTTKVDFVRPTSLIRDGDDRLFVMLLKGGEVYQTQSEHDEKMRPGDAVVCDCAYPGASIATTDVEFTLLKVPREEFAALLPGRRGFAGVWLDRDPIALRLLQHCLDGTLDSDLDFSGNVGRLYKKHIVGLVALALGAEGEPTRTIEHHNDVCAVRRAAILHEIEVYLRDPKLAPQAIAARLGITSRYLRKLLEETGKSFSEHLLDKRLERAVALLRDPQRRGTRIADIAYASGFGDLSYFNRAFRRRYGLTPSDMRAASFPD